MDAAALADIRRRDGLSVSVCLPARDEAATVGAVVAAIRTALVEGAGLVDEVVVVDDHSRDDTARVAAEAGATVAAAEDVLPRIPGQGKGSAMWRALFVADGDLICFVDADIRGFDPAFVTRLLEPLLGSPAVGFVKGHYRRDEGRVTELVARPLLARLLPGLSRFPQPLSGEIAGRRSVLEALPFCQGWAVDLGLLADAVALLGPAGVVGVDLGTRVHKHRPLAELAPQAEAVLDVALDRAGLAGAVAVAPRVAVLPPLVAVPEYRGRLADSA